MTALPTAAVIAETPGLAAESATGHIVVTQAEAASLTFPLSPTENSLPCPCSSFLPPLPIRYYSTDRRRPAVQWLEAVDPASPRHVLASVPGRPNEGRMIWIAPSEKDTDTADKFRANSGLKSQEYSRPVLGLIFLRFAEVRFAAQRTRLQEQTLGCPSRHSLGAGGSVNDSAAYHAEGILYLPAEARFDYLLSRPEAKNIGAKVNAAFVAPSSRLIFKLHGQIQNLRRTRDLLLPRLLSGQVNLAEN